MKPLQEMTQEEIRALFWEPCKFCNGTGLHLKQQKKYPGAKCNICWGKKQQETALHTILLEIMEPVIRKELAHHEEFYRHEVSE